MAEQLQELGAVSSRNRRAGWARWAALAVALGVVALFFLRPPWTLVAKTNLVGYAICHQIPSHSFHLGGRQLPLCARCTGIYLAAFGTFLGLATQRRRAGHMPPPTVMALLLGFVAVMAFDGTNSYVASFFPWWPHLYEPRNWLRLTTGLLAGVSLAIIVTPIVHATVWREPAKTAVLPNARSLLPLLILVGVLIPVVSAEIPALFYPIALASTLGVLMLLAAANTVLAAVFLRLENRAESWREAALPLVVGVGLAFLEISAMDAFRAWLTTALGLPF